VYTLNRNEDLLAIKVCIQILSASALTSLLYQKPQAQPQDKSMTPIPLLDSPQFCLLELQLSLVLQSQPVRSSPPEN
jgi:hypothetical protein